MKYIRTKDGKILPTLWQDTSTAIKQADTIEELCDEFVCGKYLVKGNAFNTAVQIAKITAIENGKTVYGAIWTDKGLIYVAKMNEKGVLELL